MIANYTGWPRIHAPCDFPEYAAIVTALYDLAGRGPFVDLGAGEAHLTKNWADGLYVDLVIRPTSPAKTMQFDIREAPARLAKFHYNFMLMSDVIEHLTFNDAYNLLAMMDHLCDVRVVFTPVGPYWVQPDATDPDSHKSAWTPEWFEKEGWEVLEAPCYHRFPNGKILGAFWAWNFGFAKNPPAELVLKAAKIDMTP